CCVAPSRSDTSRGSWAILGRAVTRWMRSTTDRDRAATPAGGGASSGSLKMERSRRNPIRGKADLTPMEDLPDDFESRLAYRIAYGEAARLAESARFDHGWGRDFAMGIGGETAAIEREVIRRLGSGPDPELVKLA